MMYRVDSDREVDLIDDEPPLVPVTIDPEERIELRDDDVADVAAGDGPRETP
jgi:hypothetical protein